jgi:putative tricarboxylic transport membrane protein
LNVVRANRWTGVVAIVLGGVVTVEAARLPLTFAGSVGPALVPYIVGLGWITCGLYLLLRPDAAREVLEDWPNRQAAMRIVQIVAIGAAYVVLMTYVGYLVSTWFLLFMSLWVMSDYGWLKRLLIALPTGLAMHLLFVEALQIPLP